MWDALRLKNTIQIIGLCFWNVGVLAYAALQKNQIRDAFLKINNNEALDFIEETEPYLVVIPCVVGVTLALMSFVAWKLYHEFAWTIYKHISADLRLKRRYLAFQVRHDHLRSCWNT